MAVVVGRGGCDPGEDWVASHGCPGTEEFADGKIGVVSSGEGARVRC